MTMVSEVLSELRSVLSGRAGVADAIIPPLVFVIANAAVGVEPAAWAGAASAVVIVAWRLYGGRPLKFALSGLAGTAVAVALALRSGQAEDYFLPGILSNGVATLAIATSLLVRRPAVAFTSWITRSWPLEWYWHPRIRPAYATVTWLWLAYFGTKTALTGWLYVTDRVALLGTVRIVMGWPGLLALLVVTYVWGRARLESLNGPSVEEFAAGAEPPWRGQDHGF